MIEGFQEFNGNLSAMGILSTAYFNPMVSVGYPEVFQYGIEHNYYVRNCTYNSTEPHCGAYTFAYEGASLYYVAQVDFSNPEAAAWYQSIRAAGRSNGYLVTTAPRATTQTRVVE